MTEKTRTIDLQTRLAQIEPATFNAEARTVEVVWSTGAAVRRYSPWDDEYYDEILSLDAQDVDLSRLKNGAPVLNSHARFALGDQIGVVQDAWIEDGVAHARLRLSGREDVAGIVQDIADGVIRNISVGYTVNRYEVTRNVGEVAIWRATKWQPSELSFVTVPADAGATVRTDARQGSPCVFYRVDATQPTEDEPMPENIEVVERAEPVQEPVAIDHTARAAEIADLANQHRMIGDVPAWIREGKTADQVRAIILERLAARGDDGPTSTVTAGVDEIDKRRDAVCNVLLARANVQDVQTKRAIHVVQGNPFRGHSLFDLARSCCERGGIRVDGLSRMEIIGRAFTQGTSDFPIILETAMHKALQSAYAIAPDTWSRFCAVGSVSDFRAHNRYKLGSIGNLDSLTELNEFQHKAIPDGVKESITAGTKGNIITLSRQAIINDDMGAFLGLATAFGRAAKRTIEANVYAYLATNPTVEGGALFNTTAITTAGGHANLAGSGAAPSVDTIEAGRVAMAKQMDLSRNDFLDLRPAIWLGPMATGGEARVINDAQYDPDTANKLQRPNKVRGLLRDIVDTPRITGTEWYLFADPADAPVIEVAFLEGQQEPYLESDEGFTVDGTRWKARLDYGIAAVDYRGAWKNPGG
jgi:hypothetical protein